MRKKRSVWLITCCLLAHTTQPYLYNLTLISLQLFKLTPMSLQLDLWLIWSVSHDLYLFELLTWSYLDSNSTWSHPQLDFQLNQIPYSWTLLSSDLAHPDLDSSLLELKILIPLLDSDSISIRTYFLNLLEFNRITYPGNRHPISLPDLTRSAYPNLDQTTYSIFI
jgi:hypothetical protein